MLPEKSKGQSIYSGYMPESFPPDTVINVGGRDVIASWFIAPVTGCIDTIFWLAGDTIAVQDSVLYLRIHRSNIGPRKGPGFHYPSPPTPWGYWKNTGDLKKGIAAYIEDATDTIWRSTIGGLLSSFPPMNVEVFGLGGFPFIIHPRRVNTLVLDSWSPCFTSGDSFFISMRMNSPYEHSETGYPTQFRASKITDSLSHAWIFFENDSGWHAVGRFNVSLWFSINTNDVINGQQIYQKGWNIVSVFKHVSDYRKRLLFPNAISEAYGYENGYRSFDTLQLGRGYWLKFDYPQSAYLDGVSTIEESTDVSIGWNLIGTPSVTLSTNQVQSSPPGIISSNFYRFNKGYNPTVELHAGEGYWVKVNQDGKIILSATYLK